MTLRILAAVTVLFGLAACSGGGGSGVATVTVNTADDQQQAISKAINTARTAIAELGDTATDADIAAAAALIDAARKAVSDADALTENEREANLGTVSLLEENLEAARVRIETARNTRQLRAAAEARKLTAAIDGTGISGISVEVAHGAPPVMSGTVPGPPAAPVADLETAAGGAAEPVDRWSRRIYRAADADAGTSDTILLYTNIEAPAARPFSGEGGKYSTDNGLDEDGNLPIVNTTDATLILSAGFPDEPGIMTHEADASGDVLETGSFDGASGAYVCTPTADSACRSSIKHGGGIELTGGGAGGWKFVPAEGATVRTPDAEHQYFGWWMRETGERYAIGLFHGGAGGATDEFADLAALQGPATYTGPAAGKFAILPQPGGARAGDFTATVTLVAAFGDSTGLGTVTGSVDAFTVDGETEPWSVELQAARIGADGSIAPGGTDTALTYWTIGDTKAVATATWSGQFHDANPNGLPVVATGRFEAVHGEAAHMVGAFGAER